MSELWLLFPYIFPHTCLFRTLGVKTDYPMYHTRLNPQYNVVHFAANKLYFLLAVSQRMK